MTEQQAAAEHPEGTDHPDVAERLDTAERPDTDERGDPGGTPSPCPRELLAKPSSPGEQDTSRPTAVPGAYDGDDEEPERGRASEPGG